MACGPVGFSRPRLERRRWCGSTVWKRGKFLWWKAGSYRVHDKFRNSTIFYIFFIYWAPLNTLNDQKLTILLSPGDPCANRTASPRRRTIIFAKSWYVIRTDTSFYGWLSLIFQHQIWLPEGMTLWFSIGGLPSRLIRPWICCCKFWCPISHPGGMCGSHMSFLNARAEWVFMSRWCDCVVVDLWHLAEFLWTWHSF